MAARRRSGAVAPAGRWVHLFEEDSARGAVYVPEASDVPLSRRPRGAVEFLADGQARIFQPSADDRLTPRPACWTAAGADLRLDFDDGTSWHARLEAPDRLLLRS